MPEMGSFTPFPLSFLILFPSHSILFILFFCFAPLINNKYSLLLPEEKTKGVRSTWHEVQLPFSIISACFFKRAFRSISFSLGISGCLSIRFRGMTFRSFSLWVMVCACCRRSSLLLSFSDIVMVSRSWRLPFFESKRSTDLIIP
mgnify:CR=1 FL=1